MSVWWLSGLLVVNLSLKAVNSKVDLDSPVRLAHCRATCLYKMQKAEASDYVCRSSEYCSQCWDTCEILQSNRSPCYQLHCGPGCQEACHFPLLSQVSANLAIHHDEVLVLDNSQVSWPTNHGPAIVYVVMGRRSGRHWGQLLQTLDSSATLPPDLELESVRVLVVDWQGLIKVYSPPPESALHQLQAVVSSLGLENKIMMDNPVYHRLSVKNKSAVVKSTSPKRPKEVQPWRLRVVSMSQQPVVVLAQISWEPRQLTTHSQLMYLVTWQLEEGVLRGNLLTNYSRVTLSLWPDTIYNVQVALLSTGSQSEVLVVDTHHVVTESPSASHNQVVTISLGQHDTLPDTQRAGPRTQLVAGVAAAVTMFLVATLTLTWRWRHRLSLPHTKLVDEEIVTPNIYRVFPPAIRLVTQPDVFRHVFSSTDNLLQAATSSE